MNIPLDGSPAGRVAIVTGGSRGVGRATIRLLAARGYAVVVNYLHDRRAAESTVEAILADNSDAVAIRADVADDLDVREAVRRDDRRRSAASTSWSTLSAARSPRLPWPSPISTCWTHWSGSTRGLTFIVNREAARHLRNGGAIVNLTSSANSSSLPAYGLYAATKAATDVLTRALALELRERDITVNAVSLEVDMPRAPDRVAGVVAYLLTDRGHRLTGHVLRIGDSRSAPLGPRGTE